METIELLASGTSPPHFPFVHASEFDPASPWSLCLAFFPETRTLSHLNLASLIVDEDERVPLDAAIASYVQSVCIRLGWSGPLSSGETIEEKFLQTRLRQTDEACRQMDIPASVKPGESAWIDGIVRVLQLWRLFAGNDMPRIDTNEEITLTVFEKSEPEIIFPLLVAVQPPKWDLRQRLEFLIMPYLRFKHAVALVRKYIASQSLGDILPSVYLPELAPTVLGVCLEAPTEEWQLVQQAVQNVKPALDAADDKVNSADDLANPTEMSLRFLANLTEAAQSGKFPGVTFRQLAEWTLGPISAQEDLLVRFLQSQTHFMQNEIETLRKTVFSRIDENVMVMECTKASLKHSRFMFIRSNLMKPQYRAIVNQEIINSARSFEVNPIASDLANVLTSLDLVDDESCPEITELKKKLGNVNNIYKTFGVEPAYLLNHAPLENVSKALESDTRAYLRYTDLVNLVGGGADNDSKVAELCVEAALADDNFSVALEFFDRQFVKPEKSDTAWLAYYQAGKYMSPEWDIPRPRSLLKRKLELLSSALTLCGESDLVTVLRAWTEIDKEIQVYNTDEAKQEKIEPNSKTHASPSYNDKSRSQSPASHVNADSARDQLSNIFKSGIGWVVGANPP